jgi:hypothetical protein
MSIAYILEDQINYFFRILEDGRSAFVVLGRAFHVESAEIANTLRKGIQKYYIIFYLSIIPFLIIPATDFFEKLSLLSFISYFVLVVILFWAYHRTYFSLFVRNIRELEIPKGSFTLAVRPDPIQSKQQLVLVFGLLFIATIALYWLFTQTGNTKILACSVFILGGTIIAPILRWKNRRR